VNATALDKHGRSTVDLIRLLIFTAFPPCSWFHSSNRLLTSRLLLRPVLGVAFSLIGMLIACICFSALLGLGANKHLHSSLFYVALVSSWFAVPSGYWISLCRSAIR
jgi:hypothetical protein